MASVASNIALNMSSATTWYGTIYSATSTEIIIYDSSRVAQYIGSNFTYSGNSVAGGTLTGYTQYQRSNATVQYQVSGLNISASAAASYVQSNNQYQLYTLALSGDDSITGSTYSDTLLGFSGNDSIYGGSGNDAINGGTGTNILEGGEGNDTYLYSFIGADTISDISGDDLVRVTLPASLGTSWNWNGTTLEVWEKNNSANKLSLLNAANIERISDGSRTFFLADAQTGSDSADLIVGLSTADNISAGNGADIVIALAGNDTVDAGSGDDSVFGARGDDTILGGAGKDTLDGEEDIDTADYSDKTAAISVTLNTSSVVTVRVNGIAEDTIKNFENVIGGSGNDAITGDSNNNSLFGGLGNDTLIAGAGNDYLDGAAGIDTANYSGMTQNILMLLVDNAESFVSIANDASEFDTIINIENFISGSGDDLLIGDSNVNQLLGGLGNDTLDGGAGADTLIGGAGNDIYYVDNRDDVVTEAANAGTDTVEASSSYILSANVENLTLTGAGAIDGTGNLLSNTITGNDNNNILNGGLGVDTLIGGAGNDTYIVDNTGDAVSELADAGTDEVRSSITFSLAPVSNVENLTLTGIGIIGGTGNALDNIITGNGSANRLNGGAGNDIIYGGLGNDTLDGGLGVNDLQGDAGNDVFIVDYTSFAIGDAGIYNDIIDSAGTDRVVASFGEIDADIAYVDVRRAGVGGNDLSFGIRNDGPGLAGLHEWWGKTTIEGQYTFGSSRYANVIESLSSSIAGVSFPPTLNLALATGSNQTRLNGTAGADLLMGFGGGSEINGGAGNDLLVGSHLDTTEELDVYNALNLLTIDGNAISVTTENVQDLSDLGHIVGDRIFGGAGNDSINGYLGNDYLDGGVGADRMYGREGNDTYVVDSSGDFIQEAYTGGSFSDAGGIDLVRASINYILGDYLENLTLTGTGNISGTGNALDNVITGNGGANTLNGSDGNDTINSGAGNDILDGGAGADTLIGGAGNDIYIVDSMSDVVTEGDAPGMDEVRASVSFTLGDRLENLVLTGSGDIDGDGNLLANKITGNAGANTLNGGAGKDTLIGGGGNDRYVLLLGNGADSVMDSSGLLDTLELRVSNTVGFGLFRDGTSLKIRDNSNSDISTVVNFWAKSTGNLAGSGYIETIDLINVDSDAISAYKTSLGFTGTDDADWMIGTTRNDTLFAGLGDDRLQGDAGNDILNGNEGDDWLSGGVGNDVLYGGDGDDRYILQTGHGSDLITDISGLADVLDLRVTDTTSFTLFRDGTSLMILDNSSTSKSKVNNFWDISGDLSAGHGYLETIQLKNIDQNSVSTYVSCLGVVGSDGRDWMIGTIGADSLNGSDGYDRLDGYRGNDVLIGGAGWDTLLGGDGDDSLDGGLGVDVLFGGLGNDTLTGDSGNDFFVFNTTLNAATNIDTIADFVATDDTIRLDNKIFTRLVDGNLASDRFVSGATVTGASDSSDRIAYNTTTGALYYDADGVGGAAAVQIALIGNKAALTADDFVVI